jgi:hypothetical protein
MNIAASQTANIINMQAALESSPDNLIDIPDATHAFAPGAYARTIILPAGSLVVGKMHRHAHINVISYGHVCVATYEGVKELSGHNVFTSPPDVKRCVYAKEDTCWTTIHITNETELDKIEADVIIKDGSDEFLSKIQEAIEGDL